MLTAELWTGLMTPGNLAEAHLPLSLVTIMLPLDEESPVDPEVMLWRNSNHGKSLTSVKMNQSQQNEGRAGSDTKHNKLAMPLCIPFPKQWCGT
jgi:hypothetical protein